MAFAINIDVEHESTSISEVLLNTSDLDCTPPTTNTLIFPLHWPRNISLQIMEIRGSPSRLDAHSRSTIKVCDATRILLKRIVYLLHPLLSRHSVLPPQAEDGEGSPGRNYVLGGSLSAAKQNRRLGSREHTPRTSPYCLSQAITCESDHGFGILGISRRKRVR